MDRRTSATLVNRRGLVPAHGVHRREFVTCMNYGSLFPARGDVPALLNARTPGLSARPPPVGMHRRSTTCAPGCRHLFPRAGMHLIGSHRLPLGSRLLPRAGMRLSSNLTSLRTMCLFPQAGCTERPEQAERTEENPFPARGDVPGVHNALSGATSSIPCTRGCTGLPRRLAHQRHSRSSHAGMCPVHPSRPALTRSPLPARGDVPR